MAFSTNLLAVLMCAAVAACGDSGYTSVPPPPPNVQHLYVGDDNASGSLRAYTLPLTASSTPVATVPMNQPFTIGVNSSTLAVATLDGTLSFFTLPLTSASTAYASFAAGSDGTPLFVANGYLYQGGSNKINIYLPPFSNSSVSTSSVTTTGLSPGDLALDPAGNIYETSGGNTIGVVSGTTLGTTLTAAAGLGFRGLAASATQLFACTVSSSTSSVNIYALPLTASATPTATINFGTHSAEGCALDASGNLYVGTPDGFIYVFAPPFTSSSTPTVTLTTPAIIFGLTVGP